MSGRKTVKPQWKDRVVGFERRPAKDFLANPLNFRRHPGEQREAFRGVVSEVGFAGAVLENVRTKHLLDGHLRIEEALSVDENMLIPCIQVDLSKEEEKLLLATFDPLGAMAVIDKDILNDLLQDVSTDNEAINSLLDSLAKEGGLKEEGHNVNFSEARNFTIKCQDEVELARLQHALGIESTSISCGEFLQKMA